MLRTRRRASSDRGTRHFLPSKKKESLSLVAGDHQDTARGSRHGDNLANKHINHNALQKKERREKEEAPTRRVYTTAREKEKPKPKKNDAFIHHLSLSLSGILRNRRGIIAARLTQQPSYSTHISLLVDAECDDTDLVIRKENDQLDLQIKLFSFFFLTATQNR